MKQRPWVLDIVYCTVKRLIHTWYANLRRYNSLVLTCLQGVLCEETMPFNAILVQHKQMNMTNALKEGNIKCHIKELALYKEILYLSPMTSFEQE